MFEIESQVRSYCRRFPVTFRSARGSELVDESGRRYIDFLAGCSALNYGHNDPDLTEALLAYLSDGGPAGRGGRGGDRGRPRSGGGRRSRSSSRRL